MVHLPERDIPVPTSVSPEAQATLSMGRLGPPPREYPAPDDVAGWKAYVAEADGFVHTMIGDPTAGYTGTIEERDIGPCPLYVLTPEGARDDDRRVYFDIHGGAWVLGGGELCKMTAISSASQLGTRTWSVDYRMPPDHPFPTPLDDCLAAYQLLLEERRPEEIIVGGASAGGNLAGALVLRARDEGLPLPAAVVFNTGAFDLTGSGDSWQTNDGLDNVLAGSASPAIAIYTGDHDLRDPYVSPLFGDLRGFPPSILLTGTRDMLLSDNVRMHRALRAAGVDAELHVWEAAGHGGFLGMAPEDADRYDELRRFAERHWSAAAERAASAPSASGH
jgi:epsilon-lactone hydrolase